MEKELWMCFLGRVAFPLDAYGSWYNFDGSVSVNKRIKRIFIVIKERLLLYGTIIRDILENL